MQFILLTYVIGGLMGQLGNQMFEIATTCALAWDNGVEAYFPDLSRAMDNDVYHHIFFRCNVIPPSDEISIQYMDSPWEFKPIPYQPKMRLVGYFQNEKHFAHHRDRIVQLFAPHPADLQYVKKKYGKMLSHPKTVSIHVRYYRREKSEEDGFIQYDRRYYEKAMQYYPRDSLFIVTSDNMDFAKANIPTEGRNVVFVHEEFYIDFLIQRLCKHQIISNSTFSWWSAWLNENPNKIVVRPTVWLLGFPDVGGPEWIRS